MSFMILFVCFRCFGLVNCLYLLLCLFVEFCVCILFDCCVLCVCCFVGVLCFVLVFCCWLLRMIVFTYFPLSVLTLCLDELCVRDFCLASGLLFG